MKLSSFLSRFGSPKFEGNGWAAYCPAHEDSHESLRIAVAKGTNNVLLKCRAGCSTAEVVESLAWLSWPEMFDVEVDVEGHLVAEESEPVDPATQATMARYLAWAHDNRSAEAAEYVERRFGISSEMAHDLRLGFDPGNGCPMPFLGRAYTDAPRLVVPFNDINGIPRGFQARDISEDQHATAKWSGPSNVDGRTWTRLAFFAGETGMDFIVVCEGPGDALTSVGAGIDAVGIRGVSHADAVVQELVENLAGRRIVLAGDNDRAGNKMNSKLGVALVAAGLDVHILELPEGVDDISAWYERDGGEFSSRFQLAVTTAVPFEVGSSGSSEEDAGSGDQGDLSTNVGVARKVKTYFDGLLYAEGLGFFVYDGGVWVKDKHQKVRSTIHRISDGLMERANELRTNGVEDKNNSYLKAALRLRTSSFIDSVIKELRAMVPVDPEDFDQDHHLLAFKDVVVNLKTGESLEHSKDFMLTRQLGFDFDPDAKAPRWERFLEEVMPGQPEMVPYLQRLAGYGITGSTAEQCFAVLWGTGANGKSIFTDTLSYVFEDLTVTTPFSTFEEKPSGGIPNDLAALRGARLVFASEGDRGKPMAESIIKRVTGQDLITARFMREEFFSFRPTFLIFLGTNHKPRFKSQDEGLWRRVKLIPFERFFAESERDHYLGEKLQQEAQGIAAWAVRGAIDWFRNGLDDPPQVQEATRSYRETSDALWGFFPGVYEQGSRDDWVWGADLWRDYEKWCDAEGIGGEAWRRQTFYEGMEERGCLRARGSKGVKLSGLKLASTEPKPDPYVSTEETTDSRSSIFDGAR